MCSISDLQDAINRPYVKAGDMVLLKDAARRVANLDMEAAIKAAYTVMHTYRIKDAKQVATAAVAAALGATEDE